MSPRSHGRRDEQLECPNGSEFGYESIRTFRLTELPLALSRGEKSRSRQDARWFRDATFRNHLAQAYQAIGDTRSSRKAVELILDWIAKCATSRGLRAAPAVWGLYLTNAIHCSRWSQCLQMLLAHEQITPIELLRVLKPIHDQLAYRECLVTCPLP